MRGEVAAIFAGCPFATLAYAHMHCLGISSRKEMNMKQLWKLGVPMVLLAAMVAGCGNGSDGPGGSTEGGMPTPFSFRETYSKLEASGKLPVLDRSDSIAGTDANANGVRDDIERYIEKKPDTQPQKNSLKALSRALTKSMTIDTKDKNALRDVTNSINISTGCIWKTYGTGAVASPLGDEIEKLTVNTRRRYDAYMKYNSAMNGAVISEEKNLKCD
jgi:hypothetical protein